LTRARDLGIGIGAGQPGPFNAITDVAGVRVGMETLIEGSGALRPGSGPVRTGVTVLMPNEDPWRRPLFAGFSRLNGCGEVTGVQWIKESGMLMSPVALTSTHALGAVYEGLILSARESRTREELGIGLLPVVGETWDGVLNDGYGFHVRREHAIRALQSAATGPVPEGAVGGGTGMICHGFKGGTGSASRLLTLPDGTQHVLGVLVQANHGTRERLTIDGYPVGGLISEAEYPIPYVPESLGSIIGIVATDAPLLPTQCDRVARRCELAVGRMGGLGEHGSGDMFLAFSTAATDLDIGYGIAPTRSADSAHMLPNAFINELFALVVEATEEAILNAMVAAGPMIGRDGILAPALPHDRLVDICIPRAERD